MKYVVTSAEMKACDYGTTGQTGIPSMVLMERAALAVAEVIIKRYPDRNRILIVAGKEIMEEMDWPSDVSLQRQAGR